MWLQPLSPCPLSLVGTWDEVQTRSCFWNNQQRDNDLCPQGMCF